MHAALWWGLEFPRGLCALGAEQWRVRRQWLRSGCFHGATVWRGAAPWPDKLRRVLTRAEADWLALCFDDSQAAEALLSQMRAHPLWRGEAGDRLLAWQLNGQRQWRAGLLQWGRALSL
ncbi:hypothetical protein DB032_01730 [Chromobacterium sp. Panama]|uniref:hypothetical protein n=1 Tax=Chromobacterium sp. Panama TaxID=2161826 RepID=UPI000D2FAEF6|nr:hypothetical protein [Chromobacterium sp. Panama]PTU63731.1 hypothetical protein DB032_01730 [Chromobacterium sp. Panama]